VASFDLDLEAQAVRSAADPVDLALPDRTAGLQPEGTHLTVVDAAEATDAGGVIGGVAGVDAGRHEQLQPGIAARAAEVDVRSVARALQAVVRTSVVHGADVSAGRFVARG